MGSYLACTSIAISKKMTFYVAQYRYVAMNLNNNCIAYLWVILSFSFNGYMRRRMLASQLGIQYGSQLTVQMHNLLNYIIIIVSSWYIIDHFFTTNNEHILINNSICNTLSWQIKGNFQCT